MRFAKLFRPKTKLWPIKKNSNQLETPHVGAFPEPPERDLFKSGVKTGFSPDLEFFQKVVFLFEEAVEIEKFLP